MGAVGAGVAAKRAKDQREALRSQEDLLRKQYADTKMEYDKLRAQDITERSEVQQVLNVLRRKQDEERKRMDARNAIDGATQQAELAGMDSLNKSYAQGVGEVAGQASQLKDQYLRDWLRAQDSYYDNLRGVKTQIAQSYGNEAAAWANFGANGISTAMSGVGGIVGHKMDASLGGQPGQQALQQSMAQMDAALQAQQRAKVNDLFRQSAPPAVKYQNDAALREIADASRMTSQLMGGGRRQTTFYG